VFLQGSDRLIIMMDAAQKLLADDVEVWLEAATNE